MMIKYLSARESGKDIWKGLFEFPLIETSKKQPLKILINNKRFTDIIQQSKIEFMHQSETFKHQLSHQLLVTKFYSFRDKEN